MRRSTVAVIILVILAVVVAGVVALSGNNNSSNNSQPASNQTNSSGSSQPTTTTPAAATITFDGSSFSPNTVTVKSGDTVAIKNTSSQDLSFHSDPHPAHTDDPDLNVDLVSAGQTKTFTVTKKGSFGYHDHFDPTIKGNIVIQ